MMAFPTANFTDFGGLALYANTVTGGAFWPLMLFAMFVVMFGGLSFYTTSSRAFASTAFFTGLAGGFLWVMGALDTLPTVVCFVMAIAGLLMLLFKNE